MNGNGGRRRRERERWEMTGLIASAEMICLYELVDPDNLSEFCGSPEQLKALGRFIKEFGKLERVASMIDGIVSRALADKMERDPRYWLMVSEFCKLRLLGHGEIEALRGVRSWNVRIDVAECRRVCGGFMRDERLRKRMAGLKKTHEACVKWVARLQSLMRF